MSRKGRAKENVAGERYDSNAVQVDGSRAGRTRPHPAGMPNMADMMGGMGGGGGPDMQQMMEMMQKMGMGGPGGGGMPGMPGMPNMSLPPEMMGPPPPKIVYQGLPEGTPVERFYTFYPNYINAKKTVQQGRRIPKDKACPDPIADEMSEVCSYFKIPHALEPRKKYPRDYMVSGRIRVRLTKEDGTPENPEIKSKKDLMIKMAELIPRLQSRKTRLEQEAAEKAKKTNAASTPATASASGSGHKKKGKKKGKR